MKITPLPLAPLEKSFCALLFGAFMSLGALADGLPPNVLKALKVAQIPAANVSVVVQPVDAATPLVAHNAAQSMNPASVMKLVTTYAALDLLGPPLPGKPGRGSRMLRSTAI